MWLLLLAGECAEYRLRRRHSTELDNRKDRGERTVDEGAVYEEVDLVEAVFEDRDPRSHRDGSAQQVKRRPNPLSPRERGRVHKTRSYSESGAENATSKYEPLDLLVIDAVDVG